MKVRVGPKKITKSLLTRDSKPLKRSHKVSEFAVEKKPKPKGELVEGRKTKKLKAEPVEGKLSKKDRKKMDRMSGQLALIGEVKPRQLTRVLNENFGEAAPKIIEMLEIGDNDNAMTLLQKRLLQSSISMLVYAEKLIKDTEGAKGTYQYATIVSQIREIITDIQANRDRAFITNSVIDQAIRPAFIDMAEYIMNDHQAFRREATEGGLIVDGKQPEFNAGLRHLARGLAVKMQDRYKTLTNTIIQQLNA